jgi:hypothetical protein
MQLLRTVRESDHSDGGRWAGLESAPSRPAGMDAVRGAVHRSRWEVVCAHLNGCARREARDEQQTTP